MPGWQTLALYGLGAISVVSIIYIAFRMIRGEARKTGADSNAKDNLEAIIKQERTSHELDAGPIPLSQREQLKRLRELLAKADRRRS